jgi:hypothetical protein
MRKNTFANALSLNVKIVSLFLCLIIGVQKSVAKCTVKFFVPISQVSNNDDLKFTLTKEKTLMVNFFVLNNPITFQTVTAQNLATIVSDNIGIEFNISSNNKKLFKRSNGVSQTFRLANQSLTEESKMYLYC